MDQTKSVKKESIVRKTAVFTKDQYKKLVLEKLRPGETFVQYILRKLSGK